MVRSRRNESVFYILGGKPEVGEDDFECLAREVEEEISGTILPKSLSFLHEFQANSHDKPDTVVKLRLYKGSLSGNLVPKNDVAEILYFNSNSDPKHFSELTTKVMTWLGNQGYVD